MSHRSSLSRHLGVTLVELLIVLSIAAIVLTLGVSGFQGLIAHTRMTNAANGLIAHLQFARSEAVKRGADVSVCPSANGAACVVANPSVWQIGYVVAILDGNSPPNVTTLLRRVDAEEMRGLTISSGGRMRFTFQGDGTAGGTNGTLTICDSGDSSNKRAVLVSKIGRVRVSDYGSGGDALTCP